jgi:Lactonase, 7-bladed beta-propeller
MRRVRASAVCLVLLLIAGLTGSCGGEQHPAESRPATDSAPASEPSADPAPTQHDEPPASLVQLPGRSGCVAARRRDGCMDVRPLAGAVAAVVSPDGRHVYVGAEGPGEQSQGRVVSFARRPSGALHPLPERFRCIGYALGCTRFGRLLVNPADLVVAPDGRFVYVAYRGMVWEDGEGGYGIGVFSRDPSSGRLTPLAKFPAPRDVDDLELTRDGRILYAAVFANGDWPSTRAWQRNARTGRLNEPVNMPIGSPLALHTAGGDLYGEGEGFGLSHVRTEDPEEVRNEPAPCPLSTKDCQDPWLTGLAASPDGRHVYSQRVLPRNRARWSAVVTGAAFAADTGSLAPLPSDGGCVAASRTSGCLRARWLADSDNTTADAIAFTDSGHTMFVNTGRALATLVRDPESGQMTLSECWGPTRMGCTRIRGLRRPRGIALSSVGTSLYITGGQVATYALR